MLKNPLMLFVDKMKYIKKFEKLYQNGDYVKIIPNENYLDTLKKFLNNNVGIIYDKEFGDSDYFYNIKYNNVPKELYEYTRFMGTYPPKGLKTQGEIFCAEENKLYFPNKEEIKNYKIQEYAKRYNI